MERELGQSLAQQAVDSFHRVTATNVSLESPRQELIAVNPKSFSQTNPRGLQIELSMSRSRPNRRQTYQSAGHAAHYGCRYQPVSPSQNKGRRRWKFHSQPSRRPQRAPYLVWRRHSPHMRPNYIHSSGQRSYQRLAWAGKTARPITSAAPRYEIVRLRKMSR